MLCNRYLLFLLVCHTWPRKSLRGRSCSVCGHTLARTTHWALAWRKENFTHNGNGQSSRGEGGWGWSGKGLHLRNCGRGADSLFWPGSTNSGNLSSSDSGVGGGASLIKAPRRQKSSRRFQAAFLIYFGWVPIKGGRRGCMEVSSASKLCAQPLLVGSSPLGKALAPDELPPPSLLYFYTCWIAFHTFYTMHFRRWCLLCLTSFWRLFRVVFLSTLASRVIIMNILYRLSLSLICLVFFLHMIKSRLISSS